jgi:hypothetical protein
MVGGGFPMKRTRLLGIPLLSTLMLVVSAFPTQALAPTTYYVADTMHLTPAMNQLKSFDISFVDPRAETYVFTDRNNRGLDVFDAEANRFLRNIPGFTGTNTAPTATCHSVAGSPNTSSPNNGGPNGVLIISNQGDDEQANFHGGANDNAHLNRGQAWAGDGDSTVKVMDLNTGMQIGASIPTGGICRADELWYDPRDREIVIGNANDPTVFLTFISTRGTPGPSSVLGKLVYDGGTGTNPNHAGMATAGIEQPIWDPDTGHFWVAVPQVATTTGPVGEIDEIDPRAMQVVGHITAPAGCTPSGLTLGPHHTALTACSAGGQILNLTTHSLLGSPIAGSGGADQVWFNPGDNHYYLPNRTVAPNGCATSGAACVAVVDANAGTLVATVPLPAGAGSHSVAADPRNNEVFVPVQDQVGHDQGVAVITSVP